MHPYPISASHHLETPFVLTEDDGNRFFRLADRHSSYSTLQSWINIECLERGVVSKSEYESFIDVMVLLFVTVDHMY